jgi:hypothetical protein
VAADDAVAEGRQFRPFSLPRLNFVVIWRSFAESKNIFVIFETA